MSKQAEAPFEEISVYSSVSVNVFERVSSFRSFPSGFRLTAAAEIPVPDDPRRRWPQVVKVIPADVPGSSVVSS